MTAQSPLQLDLKEIGNALFQSAKRQAMMSDYGIDHAETADDFITALVEKLQQKAAADPLAQLPTPNQVFRAAVWSIGSNSRKWSTFMRKEQDLAHLLFEYDPVSSNRAMGSKALKIEDLKPFFPGQTMSRDVNSVVSWADRLHCRDVAQEIQAIAITLKSLYCQEIAPQMPDGRMLPMLATFLSSPPSNRWPGWVLIHEYQPLLTQTTLKLPGMGLALTSEFLRNLGWSGFKPDRHIIRLLHLWAPDVVASYVNEAQQLCDLMGVSVRQNGELLQYALAGVAVTPIGTSYSLADNLVWALGANVETIGHESDRNYVKP